MKCQHHHICVKHMAFLSRAVSQQLETVHTGGDKGANPFVLHVRSSVSTWTMSEIE